MSALVKHICPDWHGCHKPPKSEVLVFTSTCEWQDHETVDISICPKCLKICQKQIEELTPYPIPKPKVAGGGGFSPN